MVRGEKSEADLSFGHASYGCAKEFIVWSFGEKGGDRGRIELEIDSRFETRFSRSEKIEKSDLGARLCTCTGVLGLRGIEGNPWVESSFGELQRIRAFL
ncbi:hypothetical protein AVEN_182446-1 [Araneus ventricosus]|uniref:Uncharacterized protein n=1 Tax=Araneus ventricosus TaxID=182803 RepID=A0A4Y2JZ88_ARAVE|nr:hypothetical protein AVEN_182446-1 [Araneus ventricosus]